MSDIADKTQIVSNETTEAESDLIYASKIRDKEQGKRQIIEHLEGEYDRGTMLSCEELKTNSTYKDYRELVRWLLEIVPYGNVNNSVLMFSKVIELPDKSEIRTVTLYLFTETNQYCITAMFSLSNKDKKGYLGCTMSRRKSRVGEKHHRGSDLPDGPFSRSTWNAIKHAIIKTELKRLQIFDSGTVTNS